MKQRSKTDTWKNAQRHAREHVVFAAFFVFWILITASVSPQNMIRGLVVSAVVALISRFVFRIRWPEDITPLFLLVRFPIFMIMLAWEVIKANINLAYILIRPRLMIEPAIVSYRSGLGGEFRKTVLADSITVTPGTLTLDAEGDELQVHCLAPSHKQGLFEGRCERLVLWLFRQSGQARKETGS